MLSSGKKLLLTLVTLHLFCLGVHAGFQYPEAAKFERWAHFHDFGVPGTVGDPLNQACIVDGSCRLLGTPYSGYHFWKNPARVRNVIAAFNEVPASATPAAKQSSFFTITVADLLSKACNEDVDEELAVTGGNFTIADQVKAIHNWHHAFCAAADDESWEGRYDPAYQPQQISLTSGFLCMVTCDANNLELDEKAMMKLQDVGQKFRESICDVVPYQATSFLNITTKKELAAATAPWIKPVCGGCNA